MPSLVTISGEILHPLLNKGTSIKILTPEGKQFLAATEGVSIQASS